MLRRGTNVPLQRLKLKGAKFMKINVGFAIYTDVVEFEPFLGEKISKYKKAFDKAAPLAQGKLFC